MPLNSTRFELWHRTHFHHNQIKHKIYIRVTELNIRGAANADFIIYIIFHCFACIVCYGYFLASYKILPDIGSTRVCHCCGSFFFLCDANVEISVKREIRRTLYPFEYSGVYLPIK